MKVRYDADVDVLSIMLSDSLVEESEVSKPGVVLDYDAFRNVVGIEIQDALKRPGNPLAVEYGVAV